MQQCTETTDPSLMTMTFIERRQSCKYAMNKEIVYCACVRRADKNGLEQSNPDIRCMEAGDILSGTDSGVAT